MRAFPPAREDRFPILGWKAGDAMRATMVFGGVEWNGKGLAWRIGTSLDNLYRWACQGRHGISLKR